MAARKKSDAGGSPEGSSEIIIYQTEGGQTKLEVRLQDESVWLTQQLMAELFQTSQQNISLHISNIYEEGELTPEATHKKYLSVQRPTIEMSTQDSDFDKAVRLIEEKNRQGIRHAKE